MALSFGLAAGCSSDPTPSPMGAAGSGGSSAGTTATAGNANGGSATAGSNAGGTTDTAGASGATTGGGGQAAGGSSAGASGSATAGGGAGGSGGGATSPPEGPFSCSMYIGAYLSMEWWNTNQFEGNAGDAGKVDTTKWELKWHHHAHITEWRKPDSPFWGNTGNPMDDSQGSPIQSPCAQNPENPDRIVFLAIDWELITEQAWLQGLEESVANIHTKFPSAKRVDIVTLVRCPSATPMCNPTAEYGPGANDSAPRQDCYVPDYVDSAIAKVIAAHPSYLAAGPKLEMAECNPAHDGAHMTGAGNQQAAKDYAAYYLQHP